MQSFCRHHGKLQLQGIFITYCIRRVDTKASLNKLTVTISAKPSEAGLTITIVIAALYTYAATLLKKEYL